MGGHLSGAHPLLDLLHGQGLAGMGKASKCRWEASLGFLSYRWPQLANSCPLPMRGGPSLRHSFSVAECTSGLPCCSHSLAWLLNSEQPHLGIPSLPGSLPKTKWRSSFPWDQVQREDSTRPLARPPALQPLGSLCGADLAGSFTPGECAHRSLCLGLAPSTPHLNSFLPSNFYLSFKAHPQTHSGSHPSTDPVTQDGDAERGPCGRGSEGMRMSSQAPFRTSFSDLRYSVEGPLPARRPTCAGGSS